MAAALEAVEPGMTELDAYRIVQNAAIIAAGEPAIVYGDFACGPAGERTGGPPTGRRIERGDLLILDFSVVIHGYRGDVANTFAVGAPPTPRRRELFDACLAALEAGERLLCPGVPCRDVDAAVRGALRSRGLDGFFRSHSGHGLGLGHPEPPYIVPESAETLAVGDVVTLEPGQYHPGLAGMRYEHNYLITRDGRERLSNHRLTIDPAD
jgi:Xaa-Pro aminopeptidase